MRNLAFADYREMLTKVKPDIVAICPRYADQHRDMAVAAAGSGARGIYIEKPLCRTPAEADEIIAACEKSGAKLAIAHRNRYHPVIPVLDELIADGEIGLLLEIRGRGKGDRRGGAEDLWVLGSHVLNLVHHFAGDPVACSATLLQDGVPVSKKDVREGAEGIGRSPETNSTPVTSSGKVEKTLTAYFDTVANDGTKNAAFGLQLIGSGGIISIQCDCDPLAHLCPGNPFDPNKTPRPGFPSPPPASANPKPPGNRSRAVHDHTAPAATSSPPSKKTAAPLRYSPRPPPPWNSSPPPSSPTPKAARPPPSP